MTYEMLIISNFLIYLWYKKKRKKKRACCVRFEEISEFEWTVKFWSQNLLKLYSENQTHYDSLVPAIIIMVGHVLLVDP